MNMNLLLNSKRLFSFIHFSSNSSNANQSNFVNFAKYYIVIFMMNTFNEHIFMYTYNFNALREQNAKRTRRLFIGVDEIDFPHTKQNERIKKWKKNHNKFTVYLIKILLTMVRGNNVLDPLIKLKIHEHSCWINE